MATIQHSGGAGFVSIGAASAASGFSPSTLRRLADAGAIFTLTSGGGHRRFSLPDIMSKLGNGESLKEDITEGELIFCYLRVSTAKQKTSLETQKKLILERFPNAIVYSDIGSGISDTRKGMIRMLKEAIAKRPKFIAVSFLDRFCRFGIGYIRVILKELGIELIEVCSEEIAEDIADDFNNDMRDIMNIFQVYCNRRTARRGAIAVSKTIDNSVLDQLKEMKSKGASDWDITVYCAENGIVTNKGGAPSYHVIRKLLRGVAIANLSSFDKFKENYLIKDDNDRLDISSMYKEYEKYCKKEKIRPLSRVVIGRNWVKYQTKCYSFGKEWLKGWRLA